MAVTVNTRLQESYAFFDLSLAHLAIGTYPIDRRSCLAVNRSLWILESADEDSGCFRDLLTGREFPMHAGRVYFIPSQHEVDMRLTDDIRFVSIQFNLSLANGVDLFESHGCCEEIADDAMVQEALALFEGDDTVEGLCNLNQLLCRLITMLWRPRGLASKGRRESSSIYSPAIRYVRSFCTAKTTVRELASLCQMRQDVFSRKFTRDMGITPKAFITRQLIRNASELLLRSDDKIYAIAEELDFSSEYFFYRHFKKHTGMTPGQFRKINGIP